jgi:two-component system, NtrC family, sensor kinase
MSISRRLILLLTIATGMVMIVASYFNLRQRETALNMAMRNEVHAHAMTLQIVLQDDYAANRMADAKSLIDRLSDNPKIYGVILFNQEGQIAMLSDPLIPEEIRYPAEVQRVIASGTPAEIVRSIQDEDVFSIIMPIYVGSEIHGAFEIAQPISLVSADVAQARRDIAVTTLVLFAIIFLIVLFSTRRSLTRPIKELLEGAAAVGRGDLNYRVIVPNRGGELSHLAREFNRMADSLAEKRHAAIREAEERLGLERALRHSERLSVIGRIAAGIAHEMGAPLNVIYARAGQLLAHPDTPFDKRQKNLTIIRAQAERMTRIVRQLLNLARPSELRREPVALAPLVTGTLELLEADAQRNGIDFAVDGFDDLWVNADKSLLHQVLLNIFLNAIQAMQDGGRLQILGFIEEDIKEGNRMIAVRVTDTGTGIAAEHLSRIFEPFYTTKEVGEGSGLGLAISSRIIAEHGGRIEAANNAEGGATVTVFLPAATVGEEEESQFVTEGVVYHGHTNIDRR